jgi:NAD(P)-dependent dehydrogenase (short-subunit alcohol dehydrogenase family)
MAEQKTWFITGCDKGMGYAFAETILAHGDRVVVTALSAGNVAPLKERYPDTAIIHELNVTDRENIAEVVNAAEKTTGGVDILINNAGYGLLGPIEATEPDEYRPLFEVNFFGAAEVTRAFLPHMRQRRRGYVINTTSIGGFAASPGFGFYAASKFALEGFSEALAQDTEALGIRVTILEPGSTRTDFADGSMARVRRKIDDYRETRVQATLDRMASRQGGQQPGDPRRIARALIKFSRMENPPLRFATGEDGIARMRAKLAATADEADRHEQLSLAMGFDSDAVLE